MLFGIFKGNTLTRYGTENENMTKEQLEKIIEKSILPARLITDMNQSFLAVLRDGLIELDALVEIKCPTGAKALEDAIKNKKNEELGN